MPILYRRSSAFQRTHEGKDEIQSNHRICVGISRKRGGRERNVHTHRKDFISSEIHISSLNPVVRSRRRLFFITRDNIRERDGHKRRLHLPSRERGAERERELILIIKVCALVAYSSSSSSSACDGFITG